jgi:methyl-accepting chemotaxis protein
MEQFDPRRMTMFKNLKIGLRLGLGFGVIFVLMIGLIVVGIINMAGIQNNLERIVKVNNVRAGLAGDMGDVVREVSIAVRNMLLVKETEKRQEQKKRIGDDRAKYDAAFKKIEDMTPKDDAKGHEIIAKIKPLQETARSLNVRVIELAMANKNDEAIELMNKEARPAVRKWIEAVTDLNNYQDKRNQIRYEEAVNKYGNARLLLFIIGGVAIALGIFISLLITRSIVRPLHKGIEVANRIAEGDLTCDDLDDGSKDEIGALAKALNAMKKSLSEMIGTFTDTSSHVASSSEELSATVTQITKRVDEQAGKANQVATASTQMSQTVIDIAKNSANIASSSSDTLQTAEDGAEVVRRTVIEVQEIAKTVEDLSRLMSSLGDRSLQIGQIVSVIKDIADQTNLLALNAAIEAARAGEQGRGFAVVADEVRKLAEKTAHSTSEIGSMIKAIQDETEKAVASMGEGTKKVQSGVELATRAGSALNMIVDSVNGLQGMVQQIASATEEMSTVSEQISNDIEVIAAVSKETSTGSYQIAQEATNLSKLSMNLKSEASRFRVNGNGHGRGMN